MRNMFSIEGIGHSSRQIMAVQDLGNVNPLRLRTFDDAVW